MRVFCDRIVLGGMIALMAFTPMAFGSVEDWAIAIMEWGIVTVFLIFVLGRIWPDGGGLPGRVRATGMELPLVLFMTYCALQTVPMPRPWLRVLSPGSARAYQDADYRSLVEERGAKAHLESLQDPLVDLQLPESRPISVAPRETRSRIRLLATLTGLFLMVAWWAESEARVLILIKAGIVIAGMISAEAIVQHLTWNGRIYWFRRVPHSTAFGPFVNHNHFAGYVEMVVPLSISFIFYLIELRHARGLRDEQGQWGKVALYLFAVVLLVVALFLSISRAGILSAALSGLILFGVLWKRIPSRSVKSSLMVGLPVAAALFMFWIGGETVRHHLRSFQTLHGEASYRLRVIIWDGILRSLPDFLWSGAGLGAFEQSFAPFTPPGSEVRWDKAHNDYLQLLWETGVVGGSLFLVGCYVFVRRYWWPAMRKGTGGIDLLRAGLAASMLSIALHSLVDFNLQIGSNGFLFATLAGLMVSLHPTSSRGSGEAAWRRGGTPSRVLN